MPSHSSKYSSWNRIEQSCQITSIPNEACSAGSPRGVAAHHDHHDAELAQQAPPAEEPESMNAMDLVLLF